jgi:hypothetical protein
MRRFGAWLFWERWHLVSACWMRDEERAMQYLQCRRKHQMSWKDAARQIEYYLKHMRVTPEALVSQLEMARQKLQPWLG